MAAVESRPAGSGQGHLADARLRKAVEDEAQQRLMQHYRARRWKVRDVRFAGPYDAEATKGDITLYLEAKGTLGSGESVIVTRGEVEHARANPGRCILGVVSNIELDEDGDVVSGSGSLRVGFFDPDLGSLRPKAYDFTPEQGAMRVAP